MNEKNVCLVIKGGKLTGKCVAKPIWQSPKPYARDFDGTTKCPSTLGLS